MDDENNKIEEFWLMMQINDDIKTLNEKGSMEYFVAVKEMGSKEGYRPLGAHIGITKDRIKEVKDRLLNNLEKLNKQNTKERFIVIKNREHRPKEFRDFKRSKLILTGV